jgi:ribosomal protein S18 acetylase RimI-like enzyme
MDTIRITPSLADSDRMMAARIFYEAFERKLFPILRNPEKVKMLLSESFVPGHIYNARNNSNLVGIVGLEYGGGKFYQAKFDTCFRHLGIWYGILAWIVLALFMEGSHRSTEIRIAALAVDANFRGKGIGTKLIEEVIDLAKKKGYRAVRLEVVDTNPGAYQLYQRMGFEPVRTIRLGFLTQWLGFSAEIEMILRVQ